MKRLNKYYRLKAKQLRQIKQRCVYERERGKALYGSSVLKALYERVCTLNASVSKTRKVY